MSDVKTAIHKELVQLKTYWWFTAAQENDISDKLKAFDNHPSAQTLKMLSNTLCMKHKSHYLSFLESMDDTALEGVKKSLAMLVVQRNNQKLMGFSH